MNRKMQANKAKHARQQKPASRFSIKPLLMQHYAACLLSLRRLKRSPLASLMTVAVIGIALALPSGLFVLFNNVNAVGANWQQGSQISLYLKLDTPKEQIQQLVTDIRLRNDVSRVIYVSPNEGLKSFSSDSGLASVFKQLPNNPLPPVIEVYPQENNVSVPGIKNLFTELKQIPQVDIAKFDLQWLQRLQAIVQIGHRAIGALVLLFAAAVLMVIGNTIRLATQNHKRELDVIQLIGGTRAFIRRPFLYMGLYYGLFGGVIAWLLVAIFRGWLSFPIARLAALYQSQYHLNGLAFSQGLLLLIVSGVLGLCAAAFVANRYLVFVNPE